MRIYIGQIFDAFNDGERRIDAILKMKVLSDFLKNNPRAVEITNLFKKYSVLQNKDEFIDKITSIIMPIFKNT